MTLFGLWVNSNTITSKGRGLGSDICKPRTSKNHETTIDRGNAPKRADNRGRIDHWVKGSPLVPQKFRGELFTLM